MQVPQHLQDHDLRVADRIVRTGLAEQCDVVENRIGDGGKLRLLLRQTPCQSENRSPKLKWSPRQFGNVARRKLTPHATAGDGERKQRVTNLRKDGGILLDCPFRRFGA